MLVWGAFLLPSSVFAASPYTTSFENFGVSPDVWSTSIDNVWLATTTSCYIGACAYSNIIPPYSGQNFSMYKLGTRTSVGGFTVWLKEVKTNGSIPLTIGLLGTFCNNNSVCADKINATLEMPDQQWHSLTFIFSFTSTSTIYSWGLDATSLTDLINTGSYASTTGSVDFNKIYMTTRNASGFPSGYWYIDELQNEFSLPQFSALDIANQSFALSPATVSTYCAQNNATSTGFLSEIGNGVSYGICTAVSFLFVPSSNSVQAFSQYNSSLQQVIPFSYYYDVVNILNSGVASSTANMESFSSNLASTGVGSTSVLAAPILNAKFEILSTTTIMQYVPQSTYDLLFELMKGAIWITVMFHIYRRVIPKHATNV